MTPHLGYYAHHHGAGHRRRADQVLAACATPGTLLTSRPADGPSPAHAVVTLPLDVPDAPPPEVAPLPPFLHHAPIGHGGLRARTAAIASWFASADPALLVVDVSVEVTLLARLAGVAPVVVRQHGDRSDPPHRAAYASAATLLAFWPPWAEDPVADAELRDRTRYVGATSRSAGRALPREEACARTGLDPDAHHVVVVAGFGGEGPDPAAVAAAARATRPSRWHLVGPAPVDPGRWPELTVHGVVADLAPLLSAADVVVTHAGQNAVSDAAAVGAALVVVAEPRPFGEQHHLAAALERAGVAVTAPSWPAAERWPGLLRTAATRDRALLASYVDDGAVHAAAVLDGMVADLTRSRTSVGPR